MLQAKSIALANRRTLIGPLNRGAEAVEAIGLVEPTLAHPLAKAVAGSHNPLGFWLYLAIPTEPDTTP